MSSTDDVLFDRWLQALESRHLADLTFPELSRALRALSSAYVERRGRLGEGVALAGAGKRAAFALFYAPLHYLLVREVVRALPGATMPAPMLVDLGCGTGAAGVAWATAVDRPPRVLGIDRHPWALAEAAHTYRAFGLVARTERGDAADALLKSPAAVLAAFTMNELSDASRDQLLRRFLERRAPGDRLLVVEPIARAVTPWWSRWQEAVVAAGGRADEWRFPVRLPAILAKLDRAAGLNHRELTARTLWLSSRQP
jgi:hypothetical protein